jgi:hypothetical protein
VHVQTVLPTREMDFHGHSLHVVEPSAAEYVFVAQSMQVALPVVALYFPATQAQQMPPSGPVDPTLQVQLLKSVLASPMAADVPNCRVQTNAVVVCASRKKTRLVCDIMSYVR